MAIGCEHGGVVFIDQNNLEISAFPAPPNDAVSGVCVSQLTGEFVCTTRRGEVILFQNNGIMRDILNSDQTTGEAAGGIVDIKCTAQGG